MKKKIRQILLRFLNVENSKVSNDSNHDFTEVEKNVIKNVTDFTMTSPERIVSLIRAIQYIIDNKLEGDLVECGVWKGGSVMAMLNTLNLNGINSKDVFLYDTYEGMAEPSEEDYSFTGSSAREIYKDNIGNWCYSSLDEVKRNVKSTGYPMDKITFVKGKVEDTIPSCKIPEKISLLRLDTDWYGSTLHELEHLFPRLVKGGVIIIDDYGHWSGCKKAVDFYLKKNNITLFLSRVDYTCRIGVKM